MKKILSACPDLKESLLLLLLFVAACRCILHM